MTSTALGGLNRTFGAAIALIAFVSILSGAGFLLTRAEVEMATDRVVQSGRIIRELDGFRTAMLDQETGVRGFLLTGGTASLDPYRDGKAKLGLAIASLRQLVETQDLQLTRLDEAVRAAAEWQTSIGEPIASTESDAAMRERVLGLEARGEGKRLFDAFRTRLDLIEADQTAIRETQNGVVASARRTADLALWGGGAVVLLICAAVAAAINRKIAKPLISLANVMSSLSRQDYSVAVPSTTDRNEIGAMARAVAIFKTGMIELDRTSLLRATTDTMPALVGYIDRERKIGFLNSEFERIYEVSLDRDDVDGKPIGEVFPNGFPGLGQSLDAALAGEEIRFEHVLKRSNDERRVLEAYYRPHRNSGDSTVLGVVTLLTDITERKLLELRLARQARDLLRSNEELEQFAYVASHDLKAPLRGIENLVTWIEEDLEGSLTGDVQTNMVLLKTRVHRLESLLDDLLAYSRAGRDETPPAPVDTRTLVEDIAALVSAPPGFEILAGDGLPTLLTARAPLHQVVQNLVSNAIKHHDDLEHGHVWVDASDDGTTLTFTVSDDGPGIPIQFRDRVFGMFQTLRPRDEVEGSGMGLAIVKKIVEYRGGTIRLDERGLGRGLAVHFTWPRTLEGKVHGRDGQSAAGRR